MSYADFIHNKAQIGTFDGFDPGPLPGFLFDFQAALVDWAVRKGKAAILADCGLGKTPMSLAWSDAIIRRENKSVLFLTPLAVGAQVIREAEKFSIQAARSRDGVLPMAPQVVVTNYERLGAFDAGDFAGVVCDESSILKNFDGARRSEITAFMRKTKYRLLCTATAAPNDYTELGTSSEALGELGYMDMLGRFFRNNAGTASTTRGYMGTANTWRLKGHAEEPFWRWVSSWARALRRPSDLGFDDGRFLLPPLIETEHVVETATLADGFLFALPAVGLQEQREEQKRTIQERCERVAELTADSGEPALVWCNLNDEGRTLRQIIPDAIEVAGADSDEAKEEKLIAFANGEARVLVTKPKIGAWGLNFQHCAHVTCFPSHSFEQYYQAVRRCWRFGQERPVHVDLITTEGATGIMRNLQRKSEQADRMFDSLVRHMNDAITIDRAAAYDAPVEIPTWLF